jgi:uncharacterized membrane protein HdeD (DUF308 family)
MTAWKRWQDYATIVFGILLVISPVLFGATSHLRSSIVAYVLGALLILGGVVAAMTKEPRRSLVVNAPGIAAVLVFVGGLVVIFAGVAAVGVTAIVLAIATIGVAFTLRQSAQRG